jgi:hypothetical protein
MTMSDTSRTDRIRDRAYSIWESEGRADGDHERHWHQATQEIDETEGSPTLPEDAAEPAATPDDTVAPDAGGTAESDKAAAGSGRGSAYGPA